MAPMAATGTSASTIKAAVNHVRIGNLFLEHISKENADLSARWGKDFLKVPETEICTEYFFGMVATYLASVYISEGGASKGNHISSTTAELYFNALLNMTKERLRLSTQQQTQVMCTPAHSLAHARALARAHAHAHAPASPLPARAQTFLRCVTEPTSVQGRWLANMKHQLNTLIFRRQVYGGERLDHSANEIYLPQVSAYVRPCAHRPID